MSEMGATQALARFAGDWEAGSGSDGTADATATALADTVAVAIAGASTEAVQALSGWLDDAEPAPGPA